MSGSLFFKVLPRSGASSSLFSTKTTTLGPQFILNKPAVHSTPRFTNQFSPRFFSASTATMSADYGTKKVYFDLTWEGPVMDNGRPTPTIKSK